MTEINSGFNWNAFSRTYQTTMKNIEDKLIEKVSKLGSGIKKSKTISSPNKRQKT